MKRFKNKYPCPRTRTCEASMSSSSQVGLSSFVCRPADSVRALQREKQEAILSGKTVRAVGESEDAHLID